MSALSEQLMQALSALPAWASTHKTELAAAGLTAGGAAAGALTASPGKKMRNAVIGGTLGAAAGGAMLAGKHISEKGKAKNIETEKAEMLKQEQHSADVAAGSPSWDDKLKKFQIKPELKLPAGGVEAIEGSLANAHKIAINRGSPAWNAELLRALDMIQGLTPTRVTTAAGPIKGGELPAGVLSMLR